MLGLNAKAKKKKSVRINRVRLGPEKEGPLEDGTIVNNPSEKNIKKSENVSSKIRSKGLSQRLEKLKKEQADDTDELQMARKEIENPQMPQAGGIQFRTLNTKKIWPGSQLLQKLDSSQNKKLVDTSVKKQRLKMKEVGDRLI